MANPQRERAQPRTASFQDTPAAGREGGLVSRRPPVTHGAEGGLPKFDGGSRFEFMHPEAVEAQIKAIRAMSVEDKLCVAESLRAFAWEVKRASLARQHPDLSHTERHERVRAAFRNGHA